MRVLSRDRPIADLVLIAMFDQQQGDWLERVALSLDLSDSGAVHDKKPLIGAPMAIVRTTLGPAGLDDPLGRLAAPVFAVLPP